MLDYVAVPSELAPHREFQPDPRNLSRVCNDSVFPTVFFRLRRSLFSNWRAGRRIESLPVDDLEEDLVDVHGMSIAG